MVPTTPRGNTYEGVGTLLMGQGKLEEAKAMYKKAFEIALRANDMNHPSVKELQAKMSEVNQALAVDSKKGFFNKIRIIISTLIVYSNMHIISTGQFSP